MAEQEGTILEPLHTGKALAALVDHIRRGGFTSAETVVFVHTGGLPELFGFADEMTRR
jgi:D-cysteine desulfhydrase